MILAQIDIQFEPEFVFPGERFRVSAPGSDAVAADGVAVRRDGDGWSAVAPPEPVDFWATLGAPGAYTDAARKALPVASTHGMAVGDMVVVPLHGGAYGAIVRGKRFADAVEFTVSARSSPMRKRAFQVDYVYASPSRVTLYGTAEGVLRATVSFANDSIQVNIASRFDTTGSVRLLSNEFRFSLGPGDTGSFTYSVSEGGTP